MMVASAFLQHCSTCRRLKECTPNGMKVGRHEFLYEYICADHLPVLARPRIIVPKDVYPYFIRRE